MRFAIFSDIHANLEALEAVLADARENKCTDFVCLGDVVGYNANPHECVERIREMDCPIVKGNHDEQALLVESSRDFNEMAEAAIQWTRDNLSDADKEWLRALKLQRQARDGDWHAAYCIYHIDGAVVEQRRVKYDLAATQKKIIDAGLPRLLAERLAIGR